MGTERPAELVGTAIVKTPDDIDAHLAAYELAMARLHRSALTRGYFIGTPLLHVETAPTQAGGYQILVLVAPVLDTGTDEKIEHGDTRRRTLDEGDTGQAG